METAPPPAAAVIRMLPIDGLIVPDWNPRKHVEKAPLEDLKAHLKAGGSVDRILVWGGDGKSVISGQRRLLAYRALGRTHIEAEILDISLEAARKRANSSNEGVPLYWLDRYEGWEPYLAADSGLTEDQAAATVGTDARWIRRAKNLLGVLNPVSRRLIREQLGKTQSEEVANNKGNNETPEGFRNDKETLKKRTSENSEKWQLLEDVAYPLISFWDKRSLQEARTLVEKALPVILSRQMTGPQVKGLVKWVSDGNDPEAYSGSGKAVKGARGEGAKGAPVHIPTQSAHPIQLNPPTKSNPKRPPNPTESAHPGVAFLEGRGW